MRGFSFFSALTRRGIRNALACSPLTGGEFSLNISEGSAPPAAAGTCRAPRRGKRVDTYGFYPLNSRFPLFLSPAKIGERRLLRNRGTAEDFYYRVFRSLFAVSDTILLHRWFHLRRRNIPVLRNSLARYYRQHLRR